MDASNRQIHYKPSSTSLSALVCAFAQTQTRTKQRNVEEIDEGENVPGVELTKAREGKAADETKEREKGNNKKDR